MEVMVRKGAKDMLCCPPATRQYTFSFQKLIMMVLANEKRTFTSEILLSMKTAPFDNEVRLSETSVCIKHGWAFMHGLSLGAECGGHVCIMDGN